MTARLHQLSVLLFLLALPAAAQTPKPAPFRVASIVVGGVLDAAAREIVTAQSLLVPGRDYSEEEIRHAVYRVKRLPFVLDADFTLRDGKEAGSSEVLITVVANRALFASVEVSALRNGEAGSGDDRDDASGSAIAGGRWLVGPLGLLTASLQGFDGAGVQDARVGYSRYGLFGRGGTATFTLASDVGRGDDDFLNGSLVVDLPLFGDHVLHTQGGWSRIQSHGEGFRHRIEGADLAVAWIFDTTDDPLFPTVGSRVSGGARYADSKQSFRGGDSSSDDRSHGFGLDLAARRHWSLTARESLSAELTGNWDRTSLSFLGGHNTQATAGLRLGSSTALLRRRGAEGVDLRWESGALVASARSTSPFGRETSTDATVSTGLALRNAWGLVRLTVSYVDNLKRSSHFNAFPL